MYKFLCFSIFFPWRIKLFLLLSVSCPIFIIYFHFNAKCDESRFPWNYKPHWASDISDHRALVQKPWSGLNQDTRVKNNFIWHFLNSIKEKVMKLPIYNVWDTISVHSGLLWKQLNFYMDLKRNFLWSAVLNSTEFLTEKRTKYKVQTPHC